MSLYLLWTWFITWNRGKMYFFWKCVIERFITCKTLLFEVKELFHTVKSMFQKVCKYLHFAHKYFLKSQNIHVNKVKLISLLYALNISLLQINNQCLQSRLPKPYRSNSVHSWFFIVSCSNQNYQFDLKNLKWEFSSESLLLRLSSVNRQPG